MRSGGTFQTTAPSEGTSSAAAAGPHSPWHSPVPYLFGGLAAMLGLIAFALLILACSYWKLSGYLESGEGEAERDPENGGDALKPAQPVVYEEKILVIMAGQEKPTYLATPISSRASSFNSEKGHKSEEEGVEKEEKGCDQEKAHDDESSHQVH